MAKQKKMAVRANSHLVDPSPDTADGDDAQSNSTDDDSECCWGFLNSIKEPLSCGRAFYFDPRGDLILSVGEPENEVEDFVVCSRTVARGSKVFNTMLFGGFAESTASAAASDGSWTVKLPDDQTAPFFVILSILHGNYELVPRTLEEKELYEVLVVTEKYDMTHILRPWAQRWFRRLTVNGSPQFEDKQRLMWIAWELGHEGMFCKIAKDLMLSSCIDNAGQLLDGDGVPLSSNPCHEPPGILDIIAIKRSELFVSIEGCLRSVIEEKTGRCAISIYSRSYGSNVQLSSAQCDDLFVGSFIRRIRQIGVDEIAFLSNTRLPHRGNIKDVAETVRNVAVDRGVYGHSHCDPWEKLQKDLESLIENVPAPVTQIHLDHLRAQAIRTGFGQTWAMEKLPHSVPQTGCNNIGGKKERTPANVTHETE